MNIFKDIIGLIVIIPLLIVAYLFAAVVWVKEWAEDK